MAMTDRFRVLVMVLALALGTAVALVLMGLQAKPAQADDTICTGVVTGPHDNVVVPPGAFCTLQGAQVMGNVKVLEDATLQANASRIEGNVQGDKSRGVLLQFQTQVEGDFQVKGGSQSAAGTTGFDILTRVGGDAKVEENQGRTFIDAATVGGDIHVLKSTGFIEVEFNTVGGNVKIEDNVPRSGMTIFGNQVAGNMQVFKNRGTAPKQVVLNVVREDLQCFENDPPFVGGPNAAQKAEGQCF
jgi:DUF4097 and DUF4098 domain-containing protein YvlB